MKSTLFLTLAVCTVLLSACGNKGPLVLPPKPTPVHQPVDPPAPANTVPESVSTEEDSDE